MRRLTMAGACVVAATVIAGGQAPQPQPTFRSGVDVVQLDVSVLDRNRRPVRGLTAADFTVLESGRPQEIVAFTAIDIPDPVEQPAAWMRTVGPDVVSNEMDTRRLVTIVMDDAYSDFDSGVAKLATEVAKAAIDELGPADLAAVVFTFLGRAQNFTADRAQLIAAVDSFRPKLSGGGPPLACRIMPEGCDVSTLVNVAAALRMAPLGRKTVLFISSGRSISLPSDGQDVSAQIADVQQMFRDLQQANVTVYAFDANGLRTLAATAAERSPRARTPFVPNESLHSFAESTGGRAVTNTNAPAAHVREVFRENSSYYLVGFRSGDWAADGRFRKVQVKVNRPDIDVHTRSGYFRPKRDNPKKPASPAPSALDAAIASILPSGDLPIGVSAAAFAAPGGRGAEVVVVAGLREPREPSETRRVDFVAKAFDRNSASRGAHRQTVEVTPTSARDGRYEVISRLPLPAGRYEVRVAAESGGRTGSVFVDVDVPNFAKERLSLSGLLLERTPRSAVASTDVLAGLVPVVPTIARDFATTDRVAAFARVYQGGKDRLLPSKVTLRVVNDRDQAVMDETTMLDADRFNPQRAADYRVDLPLDRLSAGQYLLRVEATAGSHRVQRAVRFAVR